MLELTSDVRRSFQVRATPEQAWALLSDTPDSIAHFPELDSLTFDGEAYTWRLRKVGVGRVSIQLTYASRYVKDDEARRISWTAVDGIGNGRVSGEWTVAPCEGGAQLSLHNLLILTFPLPRVLRPVVEGFVARENARMIDEYVVNLTATLHGGDGRVSAAAVRR